MSAALTSSLFSLNVIFPFSLNLKSVLVGHKIQSPSSGCALTNWADKNVVGLIIHKALLIFSHMYSHEAKLLVHECICSQASCSTECKLRQ